MSDEQSPFKDYISVVQEPPPDRPAGLREIEQIATEALRNGEYDGHFENALAKIAGKAALLASEPTGLDVDGWVIDSASAERDFTNGDYTAVVLIFGAAAEPGNRYRQGYGEGRTLDEAIRTAHSVALAARLAEPPE